MILFVIFVALPLVIYFGLAFLPAGRAAMIGFVIVGVLIGLLWLSYLLTIGPFFTGDRNADAYMTAAATFYSAAWALALLAQVAGRALSRRWPVLRYWLIVLVIFALTGLPALSALGI